MREIVKVSGGKITIPKKMREKYDIENGDRLVIKNEEGSLILKSLRIGEGDLGDKP